MYRRGFSLIEILLVLGIVAALIISGFFIYSKVSEENKINLLNNELTSIAQQFNSLYLNHKMGTNVGVSEPFPFAMIETNLDINKNVDLGSGANDNSKAAYRLTPWLTSVQMAVSAKNPSGGTVPKYFYDSLKIWIKFPAGNYNACVRVLNQQYKIAYSIDEVGYGGKIKNDLKSISESCEKQLSKGNYIDQYVITYD